MLRLLIPVFTILLTLSLHAQRDFYNNSKFKQLYEELPTPNVYRTASGAPGEKYWQNTADYQMNIVLNDIDQKISGTERIKYTNNSPHSLEYLWLQLDQNIREKDSQGRLSSSDKLNDKISENLLSKLIYDFDGGFKVLSVSNVDKKPISYTIVGTMMRINLTKPLAPNEEFILNIDWWYNINNRLEIGGRSGYEYFKENDNYLYTIAQFFPRMCVYNDVDGWQNKQFLGSGEFTVPFGNYDVKITVPSDHLVAATGVLQNAKQILEKEKINLLEKAKNSFVDPVIIFSEDEAKEREKTKSDKTKTWHFKAEMVRDFGFASSRKFIWDAMAVKTPEGKTTMAMSMYPKEGNPLWEKYSTKVVAHTLRWYSYYTIDYPYPVAWSINAARIGMEYPMICFNYGRCEPDGTYSKRTKYGMISVIIHEVGHNFFPMIVNSDERQWTWMDEGLNTFTQFLTEQHFERDYPSRRGMAQDIVPYMKGNRSNIMPIMTNSESIPQFGNNAYGKPATALNILRETILGRELFDYAFKTYSNRWAFKHPTPADFFRSMEDASGVDLDWFWRGWFYTTENVDISLESVKAIDLSSKTKDFIKSEIEKENNYYKKNITAKRNANDTTKTYAEEDLKLLDFYNIYSQTELDMLNFKDPSFDEDLKKYYDKNYKLYELNFKNIGGLVMPIIIQFNFEDGTNEVVKLPAEIWKLNNNEISKVFIFEKIVKTFEIDPFLETADTDRSNNYLPRRQEMSRFEIFKFNSDEKKNEMQLMKKKEK